MTRAIRSAISAGLMVVIVPATAFSSDLIEFTNKVATFTNLQGAALTNVELVRGDLDGIIWRNGTTSGRVCYTNLHPALLQDWGIPTNRIGLARSRAERRAVTAATERARITAAAQAQGIAREKEAAAWQAGAAARAFQERKETDQAAIETLQLQIESAKSQMRKAQALAHDYNKANALNRSAPRVYIKETERAKIKEAEEQLKRLKREFALKYGKAVKPI